MSTTIVVGCEFLSDKARLWRGVMQPGVAITGTLAIAVVTDLIFLLLHFLDRIRHVSVRRAEWVDWVRLAAIVQVLCSYSKRTDYASSSRLEHSLLKPEMWANAQRDGRPAECRWRPLLNAAKFGWCPILECRAVMLSRSETCWNLQEYPKLLNRSQPLVSRSWPYCEDMWSRYCCLTTYFPIADMCLSYEDIARQSCAMVPRWRFFGSCISSELHAAHFRPAF